LIDLERESTMDQTPHHAAHNSNGDQTPPQLSRSKVTTVLVVFLIVAAVLAASGILFRMHARIELNDQTQALAEPTVLVAVPVTGQPAQELVLPGNVQAYVDSPVYARTSGYLRKWYFDIGSNVHKGDLLAEIESPEVDKQLIQARADLATAEATSANAQTTATRYQGLLQSNGVSKQDTDNFTAVAAADIAAVKSAQANVQRLEALVSFEKVFAPFDGVVTARNVDTGTLIDAGANKEIFHLAAIRTLRVFVNVPQLYSRDATHGATAQLTFDQFPGRKFPGRLARTSSQIDPVSRTLLVEVDVDNSKGELLPGSYTQVHLKLDQSTQPPSLMVPAAALIFRKEGLRIGIVTEGSIAHLVPITIGEDDGQVVQVLGGIDANARVIINPPDSLIDGEKVEVVQPQSPAQTGAGF